VIFAGFGKVTWTIFVLCTCGARAGIRPWRDINSKILCTTTTRTKNNCVPTCRNDGGQAL